MHPVHVLVFLGIAALAQCLYLDTSYVWERGPLSIDSHVFIRNNTDIPMQTQVFFPDDVADDFAVWYFISGWDGVLPPEAYADMLNNVASHGYIVAGAFPVFGSEGRNHSYTAHLENIDWLKENVGDITGEAVPSWEHLSYGCHSAGCGTTYEMTDHDADVIMSNIFLEPVSGAVHRGDDYEKPAIMLGALIATGQCSIPGRDHVTYYDYWGCPKILMESREFGHCDFLDAPAWTVCDATQYCLTGPEDRLHEYHNFVQGMTAAYMNAYVQGQMHYLDYLLVEEDIPLDLSMYETDVEC